MYAQQFGASVMVGGNASQIDGDELAGYNKLGLNMGIKGTAYLKGRWELALEMLYSQRGATSNANSLIFERRRIHLGYIELPVYVSVMDWLTIDTKGEYYKIRAFAGLSYARLIHAEITDENTASGFDENLADALNTSDLGGIVGIGFSAYRNLEFTMRYNRSFLKLYDPQDSQGLTALPLVGYFISFNIVYSVK